MNIEELRKQSELVDLFCNLAEIPSPSLKEENLIEWIKEYCEKNDLKCEQDSYGNLLITVEPTDLSKDFIMLSSHMDVIGDDSPVKTYLDGDLIRAQGRTLGADDKAGIANALYFATQLRKSDIEHGGLEIMLTRDEESGMTGIQNADLSKVKSKYVLVLDSDSLGQLMTSGASYVKVKVEVNSFKGGHSGIDIGDSDRENASKLIADLVSTMPQGVFYSDDEGHVITSCNLGGISSGNLDVTNIINTYGCATYSIRSSSKEKENDLKDMMQLFVDKMNKEYEGRAEAKITFTEHMPMFEKVKDEYVPIMFETVAQKIGVKPEISSFHAGAETHIYAHKTNSKGETFVPYLVGLANVCNMHCDKEYLEYKSLEKGQELLQKFFLAYNA